MAIIRNRNSFDDDLRAPSFINRIRAKLPACTDKLVARITAGFIFVVLMVVLMAVFQPFHTEIHVLVINSKDPPVHETSEQYVSIALDSSMIAEDFNGFNMTNPSLLNLIKPLAGGYLRIGGTMADRLIFKADSVFKSRVSDMYDGGDCAYEDIFCSILDRPNFTMSGGEWLRLNKLATKTGLTILFDLNCLIRYENGTWNSSNAEDLIEYSDNHQLDVIWQLGNEPNSFRHVFNYPLSAAELGGDFAKLRRILRKYPRYANAMLVGPDVTRPRPHNEAVSKYLSDFLENCDGAINATTWHQYYFSGKDALLFYFISPDVFNLLQREILVIKSAVKEAGYEKLPLWLSETSSAYGGGAPGMSDSFIATFIWMDKLGLAAKNGLSVVVRQSLFHGHYALIDENYEPNPDWWLTVLYKHLVGHEVVECFSAAPPEVRLYCHCTAKNVSATPAVTVFGMNMKNSAAMIRLQEANRDKEEAYTMRHYIVQTRVVLLSKLVYLNDELLAMDNGSLPRFVPFNTSGNTIMIPPFSLGFWVVQSNSFAVCK